MHILLHDYAGHPFQVLLSRALVQRGHRVTHAYFAGDMGPKGQFTALEEERDQLRFVPVGGEIPYSKTSFRMRRAGDLAYGRELATLLTKIRPDIVVSGNTPTEAQERLVAACQSVRIPFIYWCQDFYSIAVSRILHAKYPGIGHIVGAYYRFLERRQMRRSSMVVLITEDFLTQTDRWGITREKTAVIPNWGAIDEIDVLDRDTQWAVDHNLNKGSRFLYSGTLALKHNPELLSDLASQLSEFEELVLVSAGVGADKLKDMAKAGKMPRLKPLPLQPFEEFSQVLASGDVLLAVIERDAGAYSVPSKILSYLCAGRPIVLGAPRQNLAAQILLQIGAGRVVEPEDKAGFVSAAKAYAEDKAAAEKAGAAGRRYAEENFVIDRVADRFEGVFEAALI